MRSLHEAGIEVILDVVYNHTAEGNHLGPTINFRGIDNAAYYRLVDEDLRLYKDFTGTGNSLNARHPHVLQLIMDSLRYWVIEMHVDGFRFDLASTLAREFYDVDRLSAFFDLVQQDPVISQVKLIAEPWDVGEGGYQVGNFPGLWTEWNGKYRDTVRDYWRGEPATLGEFASRLTGSSDLYEATGRRPSASINFVTAHDGFTLNDLVSYNEKHNEANGEDNRDGESHNRSWNCGVEGPTDDPDILALRRRQMRNFWATLMVSQGTPMIAHGDEIGRTQNGNNNVYCQDSELSWMDWSLVDKNADLLAFARKVTTLRKNHPVFRRRRFFEGEPIRSGDEVRDIAWLTPAGQEMTHEDWDKQLSQVRGGVPQRRRHPRTERPRRAGGRRLIPVVFQRPSSNEWSSSCRTATMPKQWTVELDTNDPVGDTDLVVNAEETISLPARSLLILRKTAVTHGFSGAVHLPVTAAWCLQRVRVHLRRRREPAGLPRRPRGLASLPVPDHHRGRRVDPRLRRHRPDDGVRRSWAAPTGWRGCRRRPGRAAWAWSSTSCPTTWGSTKPEQNPWWWDVLRHGRSSAYAAFFDIDWDLDPHGRIVLPLLGSDDDVADLKVDGELLRLGDLALPIAPGTAAAPAPQVHDRQHYRLVGWRNGVVRLSPFLLDHLAGRAAPGRPRGVRRQPRRGRPLVRRGTRRRRAHRPPRRIVRSRRLFGVAARIARPGRLDRDREDPGRRRGAGAHPAGRRHHRL